MTLNLKKVLGLGGIAIAMFLTALAIVYANPAFAGITYNQPTQAEKPTFTNHTFFTATTTSATSTASSVNPDRVVRLDGADKATFYFSRGGAFGPNTGSSKFEVEVSPDGNTWYDFPQLLVMGGTTDTASSTVWITAATSTVVASMNLTYHTFHFARCQVVEVTDGEHSCSISVEYK